MRVQFFVIGVNVGVNEEMTNDISLRFNVLSQNIDDIVVFGADGNADRVSRVTLSKVICCAHIDKEILPRRLQFVEELINVQTVSCFVVRLVRQL